MDASREDSSYLKSKELEISFKKILINDKNWHQ